MLGGRRIRDPTDECDSAALAASLLNKGFTQVEVSRVNYAKALLGSDFTRVMGG